MKKILFAIAAVLVCALASCGNKVGTGTTEPAVTSATTTVSSTTAYSATTAPVTTEKTTVTGGAIPDSVVLTPYDSVEVYEEVTVRELIAESNVTLTEPDTLIDTEETGEKKLKVAFEYEGASYEKEIAYSVVDTTPPLVLNSGWNPYTKVGEPFDINSIVGYVDNYDRAPTASYSGTVDTSAVGSFPITVTVTDDSGNSTSWDMTVLVLNEIPAPQDNNTRVSFADFMDYYNYENVSYGIDVSAWQTTVDYNAVKEAGCEFVLMRMGYYYSSVVMDDYYQRNMTEATAAGLDVGVYFYTTDNTEEGAREHARWIVEQLGGRQLDYPIAFDWEEWGTFQEYGMNIRDLNNVFEAFCDEIEKNGYSAMLYSSKNFLNNFWENRNNHTVWLAHYVDETDYTGPFAIWQASAYGRIPGIDGDVDMNIRLNSVPLN